MPFSTHTLPAISALIVSSICIQLFSPPRQEIITEFVSWSLIFVGAKLCLRFGQYKPRNFDAAELGIVAFGIIVSCLSSSIQKTTWTLAPLLGPALVVIERRVALLPEYNALGNKEILGFKTTGKKNALFLSLYTFIAIVALVRSSALHGFQLQLCWIFAQVALYIGLFRRVSHSSRTQDSSYEEALHTAAELATVIVVGTGVLVVIMWQDLSSVSDIGMIGGLKACRWMAFLILAHENYLSTTAWTTVFAVLTNATWVYPHGWQTGLTVLGSFVPLHYIYTSLPQSSTFARWIIFAFALYPIWAYGLHHGLADSVMKWQEMTKLSPTEVSLPTTISYKGTHHPIYHLVEEARARFEQIQSRQSKTLKEAVADYKRRYGRPPPPGFDDWYQFAIENNVQLIDEYDYMTNSLEPYWKLPPHILRDYIDQALSLPDTRLNTLIVKDKKAELSGGSFQHKQLVKLLEPIVHMLPDFKAPLNEPDEPRVLPPHDTVYTDAKYNAQHPDLQAQPVSFSQQDKQNIWNTITLPCSPSSLARSALIAPPPANNIPFVTNLTQTQDICLHPSTFASQHGFLSSPSTFHTTPSLIPILSTAKLSTFSDIMIPSSYYFQDDISAYDDSTDTPYTEKKDLVYWRGSGTGGFWTGESWKTGHRQRFVNFTNTPEATLSLLQKSSSPTENGKGGEEWMEYETTMDEIKDLFLVKFSGFIQCDDSSCDAEKSFFGEAEKDSNNDASSYKILYNLDGNSFSGRYYRFLKSNSLVFMQALFKEWHDDRILPWVHFVPISVGMEELGEVSRYFLEEEEGKELAQSLAMESKTWSKRTLREVDLTAAYFRQFLEYARLLDDDREKMECCS